MSVFVISVVVGYGFCYFVVGPMILNRNGVRRVSESFLWFGNLLQVENELKELSASGKDKTASATLRVISISKFSAGISFVGFIVFFTLSAI